jgi:hypothetical protein
MSFENVRPHATPFAYIETCIGYTQIALSGSGHPQIRARPTPQKPAFIDLNLAVAQFQDVLFRWRSTVFP